jgi:HEAT repeat protein
LPIFQRGILYGSPTIREVSAAGLGEVISVTSTKYLAGPLIVKMTGPLLRIVGDRNPSNVKVAILKTLGLILVKGGPALRAFVPQFQTTFVKALSDPSRQVRLEAISALSLLMPLSSRVDPLIKELVTGSLGKNASVEGVGVAAIQMATLEALATVLEKGGSKAKLPASVPSALDASIGLLDAPDEGIRETAAKVMGNACALLGAEATIDVIRNTIFLSSNDSSSSYHGKACAIRRILTTSVGSGVESVISDLKVLALVFLKDGRNDVREAGCVALLAAVGRSPDPRAILREIEPEILKILVDSRESIDVHRAMARGFCVGLQMIDSDQRVHFMGSALLDACLKLALSGSQRVQFAYNDVLWLALDVAGGQEGLERYAKLAVFDNSRAMRSLHSKILTKIKQVTILDD